ncbi:ribonuclease H-like protein, partial [Athelia psychrophila]
MLEGDALLEIYGTVDTVTAPLVVYTDGSCLKPNTPAAQAGSGVFWGRGNCDNVALRLPGFPTNNRAELYAVLWVLVKSPRATTVHIFTDSSYTIHTICHWIARCAARGWVCVNADIIQDIVAAISACRAPTHFFWVHGHSGNVHNDTADVLAKEGA